ncbi:MAG: hypothetical protein GY705_07665 [Bacteroidetes bacterium]|nr:hypothetical protein [Bacteroidota bacterium]
MSYRKNKNRNQKWRKFKNNNQELIIATGMPDIVTKSEDHFLDFLMHGYLDHHEDLGEFTSDQISDEQYVSFKELVDRYFANGNECFSVIALRANDYIALNKKYGIE